jgi:hypothetical protein
MSSSPDGSTVHGRPKDPPIVAEDHFAAGASSPIAMELARLDGIDLSGLPAEEAYKLGGATVEFARSYAASWLRTAPAFTELMRHHPTDDAGKCACGERYDSYARHELEGLAKAVEE